MRAPYKIAHWGSANEIIASCRFSETDSWFQSTCESLWESPDHSHLLQFWTFTNLPSQSSITEKFTQDRDVLFNCFDESSRHRTIGFQFRGRDWCLTGPRIRLSNEESITTIAWLMSSWTTESSHSQRCTTGICLKRFRWVQCLASETFQKCSTEGYKWAFRGRITF